MSTVHTNSDFNVDENAVACDEEEEDIDTNALDQESKKLMEAVEVVQVGDGLDKDKLSPASWVMCD